MKVPSIHQINKIWRGLQRHKFCQNHYASLALNINNVYMPRRPKPKQKKNLIRILYWTIHTFCFGLFVSHGGCTKKEIDAND